jgi:hypothetical protein
VCETGKVSPGSVARTVVVRWREQALKGGLALEDVCECGVECFADEEDCGAVGCEEGG